jgi:prepilin peptidase CpaA
MDNSQLLPLIVLASLVACALIHDVLFRRIPNSFVFAGMALGLAFQVFAPDGESLFCGGSGLGFGGALLGGLTGLALFLPLYLLRVLGAGDVKLVAMIGIWLGAPSVACAALWTLLAGGVLALAVALATGVLRRVLVNLHVMLATRSLMPVQGATNAPADTEATATGRLPYAVAIACGMVVELVRIHSA